MCACGGHGIELGGRGREQCPVLNKRFYELVVALCRPIILMLLPNWVRASATNAHYAVFELDSSESVSPFTYLWCGGMGANDKKLLRPASLISTPALWHEPTFYLQVIES